MKARLINWYRRLFPHPCAIAARVERQRAKEARAKRDSAIRRAALAKLPDLKRQSYDRY